jgi:hypothetical protein
VAFSSSPASRLRLAGGEDDAILLGPVADDFAECVAAKPIPVFPQIVGRYLVFESAKDVIALNCIEQRSPNVISFYFMAKLVHDVPLVHFESIREGEIPVRGFNQDRPHGFFLLPIGQHGDGLRVCFREREGFLGDQKDFPRVAIEEGEQGIGLLLESIDQVIEYSGGWHGGGCPPTARIETHASGDYKTGSAAVSTGDALRFGQMT